MGQARPVQRIMSSWLTVMCGKRLDLSAAQVGVGARELKEVLNLHPFRLLSEMGALAANQL